jgi:Histone acetyltransferase subunit NuA4
LTIEKERAITPHQFAMSPTEKTEEDDIAAASPASDAAVDSEGDAAAEGDDGLRARLGVVASTPLDPAVTAVLGVLGRAVAESRADVAKADASVAEHEDRYISMTWAHGNLMRGWDSYCRRVDRAPHAANGSGIGTGAPKQRKLRPSDRMFSIVSSTSAVRADGGLSGDLSLKAMPGVQKKKKKKR